MVALGCHADPMFFFFVTNLENVYSIDFYLLQAADSQITGVFRILAVVACIILSVQVSFKSKFVYVKIVRWKLPFPDSQATSLNAVKQNVFSFTANVRPLLHGCLHLM